MNISSSNYVPFLSENTIYFHQKLYQKYLDRLQRLTQDSPLEVVTNISNYPLNDRGNLLYNAGGVLNHELYFDEINQNGSHVPQGNLKNQIEKQYGNFENFKQDFKKVAKQLVGSGYTFLVLTPTRTLDIVNMSNQETPYLYDMIPIMNIDLWEHAYYLDYQIDKDEYIDSFLNLIDYDVIEKRYERAKTTQN